MGRKDEEEGAQHQQRQSNSIQLVRSTNAIREWVVGWLVKRRKSDSFSTLPPRHASMATTAAAASYCNSDKVTMCEFKVL